MSFLKKRENLGTLFCKAKEKAARRHIPFLLTKQQWLTLIKSPCYYCLTVLGIPVERAGIGLDRIDNNKKIGYKIGNVLPCCKICNSIRGNYLTVEETRAAVQAVIKLRQADIEHKLLYGK